MIITHGLFDGIFKNAIENSILLLDTEGIILDVNKGFIKAFGYKKSELLGKNFEILFTDEDRQNDKPGLEIEIAKAKGEKSDNNYLLNRDGVPIWVSGESVSATNKDGQKYIVKIIQDLNAQKKLEGFLLESEDFIHTIFESVKDTAFVILNSELRVLRTNRVFLKLFELNKGTTDMVKLSKLENAFWRSVEIKKAIMNVLINKVAIKKESFDYTTSAGKTKNVFITSKLMENDETGKIILLVINTK